MARTVSRQMVSDATYEPPGLFTRSTMALTRWSAVAPRSAALSVSEPIGPRSSGPRALRPRRIGPDA